MFSITVAVAWANSYGTPGIPPYDSIVLERVPAAAATQKLAPLRQQVATHPGELGSALALARGYIDIGRANADPRFVSYAEATLAPWLKSAHPSPVVLTLVATTRQYLHRFNEALGLLDRALALDRLNAQAWLTKATILQVQGRFAEARRTCRPLIQIDGHLIALTCLTAVNSLSGQLRSSYDALRFVFTNDPRLAAPVRVWILDQLADMAERTGDDSAAVGYFEEALDVSPDDGYTKGHYADLLLRQRRPVDVLRLLRNDEQQDTLLLRLAIAANQLHTEQAAGLSRAFQERYEAARRDGDFTHLREQARFLLEVRHDPSAAVELARRNWSVQREPADVRIYLAAAIAAQRPQDLRQVNDWIRQTRYEDSVLARAGIPHEVKAP